MADGHVSLGHDLQPATPLDPTTAGYAFRFACFVLEHDVIHYFFFLFALRATL